MLPDKALESFLAPLESKHDEIVLYIRLIYLQLYFQCKFGINGALIALKYHHRCLLTIFHSSFGIQQEKALLPRNSICTSLSAQLIARICSVNKLKCFQLQKWEYSLVSCNSF